MFYLHTRFDIPSASGSNQQLNRSFSAGSMVFLYILQNDYLQQTYMFFRLLTTHCFKIVNYVVLALLLFQTSAS